MKGKHGQSKIIKLLIQLARTIAQKKTKHVDWLSLNQNFFMDVNKFPVHKLFPFQLSFEANVTQERSM